MALTRLRHAVISRAPFLLRARLLSSTRSFTRSSTVQNATVGGDTTLSRLASLSMFNGVSLGGVSTQLQELIDKEDEKSLKLKEEWGLDIHDCVVTALKEIHEYNPRCMLFQSSGT